LHAKRKGDIRLRPDIVPGATFPDYELADHTAKHRKPSETNEFRTGIAAHWPFLSDSRRTIQNDLDIAEYTDPAHNPMIPHTIVLEPGLLIYLATGP
jgi:hypothetical protein